MEINSKRSAFSWDSEYRSFVDDLRDFLRFKEGGRPGNIETFMMCLAVGFDSGVKRDVPPRKSDSMRIENLKKEHFAIMRAVALRETKDSNVLLNDDAVFDIAEQYAAGGLMLLAQKAKEGGDFRLDLIRMFAAASTTAANIETQGA
ncbi:MAG: hypothetical protein RI926_1309 [Actinomycetota bacterium]|jgi:hypothetical protein